MTFEEWKEKHNDLIENVAITFFNYGKGVDTKTCYDELEYLLKRAFNAGKPKWHNVADGDLPKGENYGRDGVHRDIYLKDRYGKLYTGKYYPKDESHREDCFAVEFLEWGFQGARFCMKEQISEWCEIPVIQVVNFGKTDFRKVQSSAITRLMNGIIRQRVNFRNVMKKHN